MPKPPANIDFGVDDRPPTLQVVLLGIQYAFLLSVYLVIVVIIVRAAKADPAMARSAVSMAMIAAAIATVLQALPRGPVGSGYMAPPVYSAIYLGPSILAAQTGGLPAVFAMTVFAGLVEALLSPFLHRLRIIMQPTISGLTICVIALQLGVVGMQQTLAVHDVGTPAFPEHVAVSVITLGTAIGLTIWGKGVWKLVCSLLGMIAGVTAALIAGLFPPETFAQLAATPWFALPDPRYISFRFDIALLPTFLAAGLAATLRTIGVVTTCQKANDASWTRPDFNNLRKGVLADGLGCAVGGALGAPGMNIAPSLVGVSIATGVTSRVIAYACATVLVILAFVPKIADAFLQLPMSVAGALLVFTASIMLASGLQLMISRVLDLRSTFIIGLGLLVPLTRMVSPDFFAQLPSWVRIFADSDLAVSLIVAIGLLLIFRIASRKTEVILWKKSDEALTSLRATLEKNTKAWGLNKATIDRVMTNVEQAILLLKEGRLLKEPLAIEAIASQESLDIELHYTGLPLFINDINTPLSEANEESPAAMGMQHMSLGVFPDRSSTTARGSESIVRLGFDIV
ncbi:uracil-xanthine permease family protein [Rhodoligotrophos defluvii]|uniref:uracil-xanthine permease family protein n=1 Tax=Rhodoligotrophos defluvii TaxID=2561934 RepID=UPI001485C234|nr:solute carrier family 23 protein [Rhodoligotrophos defluvii]